MGIDRRNEQGTRGTINWRAFDAAKDRLRIAETKVTAMRAANDISLLAGLWEEFLTVQQQVFLRLRKAFEQGPARAWWSNVDIERRADEMLQYVMQARHANEHNIDNVTKAEPSHLLIRPKEGNQLTFKHFIAYNTGQVSMVSMDREAAAKTVISFVPANIVLAQVHDRNNYYDPPTSHLGQPIEATPIRVAELTISYLANKMTEAQANFGPSVT